MRIKTLSILAFICLIQLFTLSKYQLHYDEAYYWVWSQNLQLSYFDHPPMIAYVIKLFTLFSNDVFFIRLSGFVCTLIALLFIYKTTKRAFGKNAGYISIWLALAWPILEGNFFITTIDCPFLMFWSITVYYAYCGLIENNKKSLYLAGVFAGCALLSKYIAVLLLIGILIFIITSKEQRKLLLKKDLYLVILITVLVFSPVIFWNYQHQWVSFLFQLDHGMGSKKIFNPYSLSEFIGATLGLANPFISLSCIYFILRNFKASFSNPKTKFLLICGIVPILFFAYNSIYKFQEANWVTPAFISLIPYTAYYLSKYKNSKFIYYAAISLIILIIPIFKFPEFFVPTEYQNKIPSIDNFMGQKENYDYINEHYIKNNPDITIVTCHYGDDARARYYLHTDNVVVLPNAAIKGFKYFGEQFNPNTTKEAIYICKYKTDDVVLQKYFKTVIKLPDASYSNNFVSNKLNLYLLKNN